VVGFGSLGFCLILSSACLNLGFDVEFWNLRFSWFVGFAFRIGKFGVLVWYV